MSGQVLESCTTGVRSSSALISDCAACARIVSLNIAYASSSKFDADVALLGVELHRMHAALAPDAGRFHAAERRAQIAQKPRVDPGDADVESRRHAMGA